MLYASASEGYRPNGVNVFGRVGDLSHSQHSGDELWNYELGAKGAFLDGHVNIHAATFYQSWKSVQTDQLIEDGFVYTGNVREARNLGFEAELALLNIAGNDVGLSVTGINPEIINPAADILITGDSLPGSPHLIASGSLTRHWGSAFGIDTRTYFSGLHVGQANTSFFGDSAAMTDEYFVTNLSAEFSAAQWRLNLFMNNILDAEVATFAYGDIIHSDTSRFVTPLHPREVGIRVQGTF